MASTERASSGSALRTAVAITVTSLVTREVRSPVPASSTCPSGRPSARSTNRSRSSASIPSPSRATSARPQPEATAWPTAMTTSNTTGA